MTSYKLHNSHLFVLISFLLVFSLLFHHSHSHSQELCHPHDKSVLFRIKKYWGNPTSLAYWDPNVDCCNWDHLLCDEQGHITTFRISEANDIHGTIPPFLDDFPSIDYLQFDNMNNLSGPVPSCIGKLTKLTGLVIAGTNVRGLIPNFLSQLKNLVHLELSSNKLTSPVPPSLAQLSNLNFLSLSFNKLSGPIPDILAQLSNLNFLSLSFNKLSGPIPDILAQELTNLDTLELQGNSLSGPIPKSLGRNPNLSTLWLSRNILTGDASFLFDKKNTGIQYLDVSYNRLKFNFSKVDLARNIVNLDMRHNMVYGSLPLKFGLLDPLAVDVSYNQLCGPIPNGRRFKRANPDIFAHNKCLCGGPLSPCKSS